MKRAFVGMLLVTAAAGGMGATPSTRERFWPAWRGPESTGEAPSARPPVEWSETKNVRWKVAVPGRGLSSPVVWGDLVFLTTAVPSDKPQPRRPRTDADPCPVPRSLSVAGPPRRHPQPAAAGLRRPGRGPKDGKVKWSRTVREAQPHEGTHKDGSFAAGSVTADGERVVASFGSQGLFCLDHQGSVLWEKQLGADEHQARVRGGQLARAPRRQGRPNWDHEGPSFIAAFDAKTGRSSGAASATRRPPGPRRSWCRAAAGPRS